MSWPSCARVSLTCPWPCARGVPACVCPVAVGLAAPWPLTVATGPVPGIAVETAWPRIICVTTCCPPWPGRQRCITLLLLVIARHLESVRTLICTALTSWGQNLTWNLFLYPVPMSEKWITDGKISSYRKMGNRTALFISHLHALQ